MVRLELPPETPPPPTPINKRGEKYGLSASRDKNLPIVEREIKLLKLWPFDLAAAREYSRIFASLHQRGIIMQPIDCMIAGVALTLPDCTVVSKDTDFSRVPGLSVEDWAS